MSVDSDPDADVAERDERGSEAGEVTAAAAAASPASGAPPAPLAGAAGALEPAAAPGPAVSKGESKLMLDIRALKAEQDTLRAERKRVAKELKSAERRKSRLKKRARQLSDGDLLLVMALRKDEAATTAGRSEPADVAAVTPTTTPSGATSSSSPAATATRPQPTAPGDRME